jgi:hypothetical protein
MSFSISDFKVGQKIDNPAKIKLWENIIKRTFGGFDCAMTQYEKYSANGTWQSYKINGMIGYLDELTGGYYGKNHPQIEGIAGTLATQFKKKFSSIHYLMTHSLASNVVLDREFNISPSKPKIASQKQITIIDLDRSKVYSILSEIYAKNLSVEEVKFIAENLLKS